MDSFESLEAYARWLDFERTNFRNDGYSVQFYEDEYKRIKEKLDYVQSHSLQPSRH